MYLNTVKAVYDKHIANIIFNVDKLKTFPLKSGMRQGCLLVLPQIHTMEKRQPHQQMLQGKVAIYLQKTERRSMPVTLYFYQLKENIKDFNIRPKILELLYKRAGNTLDLLLQNS
jgi:hypothetical protein